MYEYFLFVANEIIKCKYGDDECIKGVINNIFETKYNGKNYCENSRKKYLKINGFITCA